MEIDTNSTSLATLALPSSTAATRPAGVNSATRPAGDARGRITLAKPRTARCKQWLTVRWQRAPAEPRCDLREMSLAPNLTGLNP